VAAVEEAEAEEGAEAEAGVSVAPARRNRSLSSGAIESRAEAGAAVGMESAMLSTRMEAVEGLALALDREEARECECALPSVAAAVGGVVVPDRFPLPGAGAGAVAEAEVAVGAPEPEEEAVAEAVEDFLGARGGTAAGEVAVAAGAVVVAAGGFEAAGVMAAAEGVRWRLAAAICLQPKEIHITSHHTTAKCKQKQVLRTQTML
jgi:hypothetical protein